MSQYFSLKMAEINVCNEKVAYNDNCCLTLQRT